MKPLSASCCTGTCHVVIVAAGFRASVSVFMTYPWRCNSFKHSSSSSKNNNSSVTQIMKPLYSPCSSSCCSSSAMLLLLLPPHPVKYPPYTFKQQLCSSSPPLQRTKWWVSGAPALLSITMCT